MKKATMLTYLEEQLEKHLGDYEVGLDWDRKTIPSKSLFV